MSSRGGGGGVAGTMTVPWLGVQRPGIVMLVSFGVGRCDMLRGCGTAGMGWAGWQFAGAKRGS